MNTHAQGASPLLKVRNLGRQDYETVWRQMQAFTAARDSTTADELWLLEHAPVFTVGLNGKSEHVLDAGDIPVVHTDRGGQVTYHGPGQLIAYFLLDIARRRLGVVELVRQLEQCAIDLAAEHGITAVRRPGAPGVYVEDRKLAAIGLRVRRGRCYHGLALNVDMDTEPFRRINPCGYPGLETTQLADLGVPATVADSALMLRKRAQSLLGYTVCPETSRQAS